MNRVKEYLSEIYKWYGSNIQKIIFVVGLHFISSYFVSLPYINIFTSLFSFLPYFFDWIAILILFKPRKDLILEIGLFLFIIAFPLALLRMESFLEVIGGLSFFMIGTYIIFSLHELRKST